MLAVVSAVPVSQLCSDIVICIFFLYSFSPATCSDSGEAMQLFLMC